MNDDPDILAIADRLCHGNMSPEERDALAEELREKPERVHALQRQMWMHHVLTAESQTDYQSLAAKVEHLISGDRHSAVLRLDRAVRTDIIRRRRRQRIRLVVAFAAAAVLIGAVTTASWMSPNQDPQGTGQSLAVDWRDSEGRPLSGPVLSQSGSTIIAGSDGSRLLLGPQTRINIQNNHHIQLLSGVVDAEITPRSAINRMVFVIADNQVTVVGTRLRLLRGGAFSQVSVSEGKVTVTSPFIEEQELNAGEEYSSVDEAVSSVAAARTGEQPQWRLPIKGPFEAEQVFSNDGPQPSVWSDPGVILEWEPTGMKVTHQKNQERALTWFTLPPVDAADFRIAFDVKIHHQGPQGGIRIGSNGTPQQLPGYPERQVKRFTNLNLRHIQRYEMQFRTVAVMEGVGVLAEGCLVHNGNVLMRTWTLNPDTTFAIIGRNCSYSIGNIRYGPLN